MEELGDRHNSIQALAVDGEDYLSLAERQQLIKSQESKSLAEKNFFKAENLIKEAFDKSK